MINSPTQLQENSLYPQDTQPLQTEPTDASLQVYIYAVLIICVTGIIGALGYRYYKLYLQSDSTAAPAQTSATISPDMLYPHTATPTPTPIPLNAGPGEYGVSHPKSAGPRISKVLFNPLDVRKGDVLIISTAVVDELPVQSVTGTLTTDSGVTELNFTKKSTEASSQTWSTQITLTDSVWNSYILTVTAKNSQGATTVTVAPRS